VLRVHLDVNADRIVDIGIHNTGFVADNGTTRYKIYDLTGCEPGDTFADCEELDVIYHNRDAGAHTLAARALMRVEKYVD